MKKLRLDSLAVETFATVRATPRGRGTVAAHELDTTIHCQESYDCPDSWGGTCWISCGDTCACDTSVYVCN